MDTNPNKYSKFNGPQNQWARNLLCSTTFRKSQYGTILDIGCGTGQVTNMILKTFNDVRKVIAVDVDKDMIQFAQKNHPDPKIEYVVGDMSDPKYYKPAWNESIDLVTGFLSVHWIPDQSFVLRMVKSLLTKGGEFLFTLVTKAPPGVLEAGELSVHYDRWKNYFQNSSFSSHHIFLWEEVDTWRKPDPVAGYMKLVEDEGLNLIRCEVIDENYIFPDDDYVKGCIAMMLPHLSRIPDSEKEEYLSDCLKIYRTYGGFQEGEKCSWPIQIMVVHGMKNAE